MANMSKWTIRDIGTKYQYHKGCWTPNNLEK